MIRTVSKHEEDGMITLTIDISYVGDRLEIGMTGKGDQAPQLEHVIANAIKDHMSKYISDELPGELTKSGIEFQGWPKRPETETSPHN